MHLVTSAVVKPMLAGDRLQRFITGASTAEQTCARQERDLRAFARKACYKGCRVWKETASGAKQERAELTR